MFKNLYYKTEKLSFHSSVCIPFDVSYATLEPLQLSKHLWSQKKHSLTIWK